MSGEKLKCALTPNAIRVLESRYLGKADDGSLVETPEELFQRVAGAVAAVEGRLGQKWSERFFEMMVARRFVPNSPTLMNAGRKKGQLSACFVLPVEDSLESIFDALKASALIHQSGGGTGFSFSRLRSRGSPVRTTHGVASGPVSFIKIFDVSTETIKQGGARRGANMAILRVDHPDILEFIDAKVDFKSITNFNLSVGITDAFMRALRSDGEFDLVEPGGGAIVRQVRAREIFDRIVRAAWTCGDPGLVFLDRANFFNPTPQVGEMESTNPCGEQVLLPYESCNLGSLNLGSYWRAGQRGGEFDWELYRADICNAVRFLDNVIDINFYPVKECAAITKRNRKIGLGVMGLADLLLMMDVPYGTDEAREIGERLMSFLDRQAKCASAALAVEKGAFKNWKGSLWQKLGYAPMRNATVSTVAPTGTISMIAGASSGIEPIYSGVLTRNVLSGARLTEVHPAVADLLAARGISVQGELDDGRLKQIFGAPWSPSHSVSVRDHVKMQAVFQRHSDSAVSKTINLPFTATAGDVASAYELAFDLGCKGITVYRDQSRPTQVLESAAGGLDGVGAGGDTADHCPSC